jgi:hypothetical protein
VTDSHHSTENHGEIFAFEAILFIKHLKHKTHTQTNTYIIIHEQRLSERAERRYNDNDNDNEGSGNIGGTYNRTTSIYIKEIIREREREREREEEEIEQIE